MNKKDTIYTIIFSIIVAIFFGIFIFIGISQTNSQTNKTNKSCYTPEYYKERITRITEGKCEYLVCNWNIVHCGDCSNCVKVINKWDYTEIKEMR